MPAICGILVLMDHDIIQMKKYFEIQANVKEYEKTICGVLDRLEFVRLETLRTQDEDQRRGLLTSLTQGCRAVINSTESMFGTGERTDPRSIEKELEKLLQDGNYDDIQSVMAGVLDRFRTEISSGCHRIMCKAAARVPESEISAEIQTVLNMLGEEIVLSGAYDADYPEETDYMRRKNKIYVFPYDFADKYDASQIKVYEDAANGLKYVYHHGKKLYFPNWNDADVQREYNQLVLEQDEQSPHRYFDEECCVNNGDVFVDVGTAEGIISLDIVDRASEIYLIECSDEWIKTLNETFRDYRDKVHIIPRYAGAADDDETITIDTLLKDYVDRNVFIKMDIEGMEPDALVGARRTLARNNCKLSCAVYHTNDEGQEVTKFFEQNGYRAYPSDHYMLFLYCKSLFDNGKYERIRPPYFRNGVIRAVRFDLLRNSSRSAAEESSARDDDGRHSHN